MLRKYSHIALILFLGLYYNSVPIAWLSYTTFAEKIFAEHCVNPTKPSCHGKCQVMSLESKSAKSTKATVPNVQFPQLQPTLLSSLKILDVLQVEKKIGHFTETPSVRLGILQAPFHPPKILA